MGLVVVLASCGVFSSDDPTTTEGSSGGTPDQNAKPPGVDGAPLEGVFVSFSKGNDATGDGSQEKPLGSIGAGLRKGQTDRKRVLVCAETYAEQVTLIDGVSMYGYFDCSGAPWKLDETKRAKIAPTKSPAVRAENLKEPTRLEGFEIVGPELGPRAAGDEAPFVVSSVGVFVTGSKNVVFSKSTIAGGHGADGVDGLGGGVVTSTATRTPQRGKNEGACASPLVCSGANPSMNPGGQGGLFKCDGVDGNPGGTGGGGCQKSATEPKNSCYFTALGSAGDPTPGTSQIASGGALVSTPLTMGANGVDGSPGTTGAAGASGRLSLDVAGPGVIDGSVGDNGASGQGGGGGGGLGWSYDGNRDLAASGGGGGAGGCGGRRASRGGWSGGSSVGIYVVASTIALEKETIRGGLGGRAGAEILAKRPQFRGLRMKSQITSLPLMSMFTGCGLPLSATPGKLWAPPLTR